MTLTNAVLVIGNKAYSSWSLRPWMALTHAGAAFQEVVVPLYQPDTAERLRAVSPSGLVPVLRWDGGLVWDSLAICETVAEAYPAAQLWPADPAARALARAVAAEMHAGFMVLRARLPMNLRRMQKPVAIDAELQGQIDRVTALWQECRSRFGSAGPFLFGTFSVADCMFAPVVTRFHSYAIALEPTASAYCEAMRATRALQAWTAGALAEPWHHAHTDSL